MTAEQIKTALEKVVGKTTLSPKGWLRMACPTCSPHDSKKKKRFLSLNTGTSHCFICKKRLDIQALLWGNLPIAEDIKKEVTKPEDVEVKLPGCKFIPVNMLSVDHPAIRFLVKDHLTDFDLYYNRYGAVYCPAEGGQVLNSYPYTTSAERLIFPVKSNGKLIGWQMRSIPGTFYGDRSDVVRYYHKFSKGSYLYNSENVKKDNIVIVVEGIKKAWKLPDNCVATLGKGVSSEQIKLLQAYKRIVVMLDADKNLSDTTQKEARILAKGLSDSRQCMNIDLGKYGIPSPDEATSQQLMDIVFKEWSMNYKL